jgi:hypothetical protein
MAGRGKRSSDDVSISSVMRPRDETRNLISLNLSTTMASAEYKENPYLAHVKTVLPKAEGYEDPFDGCIPRKVNADKAKEILVCVFNLLCIRPPIRLR